MKNLSLVYFLLIAFAFISCSALADFNSNTSSTNQSSDKSTISELNSKKSTDPGKVQSWAYQKLLIKAIEENNIASIKKYLDLGANPNWGDEEYEPKSALYIAASIGCKECIKMMATKADFNFSWKHSWFLPIAGAAKHSKEMLVYVIENYDVDVNAHAFGRYGQENALASVVSSGKAGCIAYLLSKGINPNYGNPSPWYDYVYNENIKNGKIDEVKAFIKAGANLNVCGGRTTVLGKSVDMKRTDIAKLLIEAGSDPNYCDNDIERGRPALYYAIDRNNYEVAKLLVEKGAKVNCRGFNDCRCEGSLLDYASGQRDMDGRIIDLLISKGAR